MITVLLLIAHVSSPTQGYYAGLSTLYPYKPVYCDDDTGHSACYGSPGDLTQLPKSAPLPLTFKWCKWADMGDPKGTVNLGNGWAGITGEGWYQWEPRTVALERQKYLGERVCYFEDRGNPKNINDLKREP